jgi:murein DD-endopeptidase MepM/ murein hydrolase activator NlpD
MVNLDARRERHARLKKENVKLKNPSFSSTSGGFGFFQSSRKRIFKDVDRDPMIGKLCKRIVGLALTFLLITPFMATYQLTQNAYGQFAMQEELGVLDLTGQNAENAIAEVMTEDGFLLKPAIVSAEGDRTGFSDIFVYTVEPGDTLSTIAEQFNLKKETLMAENNLWNPNRLKVGTKIKILPVDGLSHMVKGNDTLEKIAKEYKVELEKIVEQNQLEEGEVVADSILIIPGAKREAPTYFANTAPASAASYTGPSATGRLIWPAAGGVTQGYHSRHLAVDIANTSKGPIYAAAGGKIIKAAGGWNGGYGNVIIIDHGNGMQTLYAHNEKLYVTKGQYVEQGQTIAWMGRTGRVYGPTGIHLHFEVRIKGVKYNPMNFF